MRRAFTFDEVALVPQFNNIPSRTEPDLRSWLTRERRVEVPLVAANMDTVIGPELAELLIGKNSVNPWTMARPRPTPPSFSPLRLRLFSPR